MKHFLTLVTLFSMFASPRLAGQSTVPAATPSYPRPLVELYTSYFPLHDIGEITPQSWAARRQDIRERVLLAAGLFPLPTKTPLNTVVHGRVERDDYTVDRVFFESFPGHYVTGNLYLPKNPPPGGKMPGILSAHGHWTNGRFMDVGEKPADLKQQLAIGAERWESGARSPLHARCVQLARMGCAVFFYDMVGYADSIQIREHRSGRRPELNGKSPGSFGLFSPMADLRLQSSFGLQTWNSIRALDFLLTVAGVDPARLAITGESGGGTQTLMLGAIDDRLAAAFPCVMTSTAMQGGCTCENACYLRINQGNIDITAAFAPKPLGLTAANDWTKELATKGFPDLKRVWSKLGHPDNVMATFNVHWQHNYNHVSRTTMYGFMNQHFKLGFSTPVLEREFVVPTTAEITVWTGAYPKPADDKVGPAHERALLKHWSEDSDRLLSGNDAVNRRAWEIMVGRKLSRSEDVKIEPRERNEGANFTITRGTARNLKHGEDVPFVRLEPKAGATNGTVALWLSTRGAEELLIDATRLGAAGQKLIDGGVTIICPTLYLADAKEQPMNPVKSRDPKRNEWQWSASYTYGYNHPLVMHRVHDAMTILATVARAGGQRPAKIILAGRDHAGVIAAITAAVFPQAFAGAVIDTGGFRFASLDDQWHPLFVPGAVKYGDVPGLLRLCAPLKPTVLGEKADGGIEAVSAAILAARNK